jgi:beta-galactosidase
MKSMIIVCLILFTTWANAQHITVNNRPLEEYIVNTAFFEENQTAPHAPLAPFDDWGEAIRGEWTESQWVLSLNGKWKFKWSECPDKAPWDFYQSTYDVSGWDEISVPSDWQMQGFGDPKFRNVQQPFPSDPPNPPVDYNPVGSYRRTFTIPDSWSGRRILLYFEGVKTAAFIWVNGRYIGYNEGGMEPAEFDVTNVVHTGENQIAVQVLRYADATYLECQDMWRLSGIYRPVYLLAMPKTHIRDYYITSDLDEQYQDALLTVEVDVINTTEQVLKGYQLYGELLDEQAKPVIKFENRIEGINAGKSKIIKYVQPIKNPRKWSAEKPNLYTLILTLKNEKGERVHTISQAVGFRKVEIRGQALWINGVPVKLNGVCSHVHHPETGRTMDINTMHKDPTLMKQFNINCVRTSHYPQNREYYDLADRLGMYIIDETNDESHATEWVSERPEWREMYLDRARKMVYRDRNHPSIIIWSAGNESGSGENICALIEEGKRIDPSRPAWLYGGNNDYYPGPGPMACEDIVGPRYPTPYELKVSIAQSDDPRPSFMDEYVAVTGNSGGMFDEFWEVIRAYPRTIGGAVWDWVSPTIHVPWIETTDASSFGNSGAIIGRYALVPGMFGKALELSGQDAWVEIYRAPELDFTCDALTLSLWVKPKTWNGLESYITKGNWQFGLRQSGKDSLEFYTMTRKRVALKAAAPQDWVNNWHHLLAVYDGTAMKLYIDGVAISEKKQEGRLIDTPFPINIGRNCETDDQDFTGNMCNALLDRVVLFDKALSPAGVSAAKPEEARLWYDFESAKQTNSFYSYGIGGRTYGLIWADRRPQPELYQLKKSGQPLTARAIDLSTGEIEITNWHHFTNLNELSGSWRIEAEGRVIQLGILDLEIKPLQTKTIRVPFKEIRPEPGVNYYLTLSWTLPKATTWAEKGHEVAFAQFDLPTKTDAKFLKNTDTENFRITVSDESLTISGVEFSYTFSKKSGEITSIRFQNKELIQKGPRMNVWRAPLANDLDQWTFGRGQVTNFNPALGRFVANGFWAAGLDRLVHYLDNFNVQQTGNHVKITIETHAAAKGTNTAFDNRYIYTVMPPGDILLTHTITPEGEMPHYLPKMGLQMVVNPDLKQWTYLGRGPFETYPDRKTGAKIGVWQTTVQEAYVPYLIPQDHANRTDVVWTTLTDGTIGLFIQAAEPLNVSAHIWDEDNLSRALVIPQLKPFNGITLNIDPRVSGVGCTAVSLLNKHKVFPSEIKYTIRIRPFAVGQTDPVFLGRQKVE